MAEPTLALNPGLSDEGNSSVMGDLGGGVAEPSPSPSPNPKSEENQSPNSNSNSNSSLHPNGDAGSITVSTSSTNTKEKKAAPRRFVRQQVPDTITNDPALLAATAILPAHYNLEIPKTIWRLRQSKAKRVALQLPEGLLMFALVLSDILEKFADLEECFVLGDVTYGACCVDDFSAFALGADFLVHYGHSCLVPIDSSMIPCLYVFVEIHIDVMHLIDTIKLNFDPHERVAMAGTIQFGPAVHSAKAALSGAHFESDVIVPQEKPLSGGEVLGCTAPSLPRNSVDSFVFVSDGRFHMEAFMIANPSIKAFRYDPYSKVLSLEEYDHKGMRSGREKAINQAGSFIGKQWGVVLGTLGRQGNLKVLSHVENRLASRGIEYNVFLVSELSPTKISLFEDSIQVWVQIACPRLSIDWGEAFTKPLLTPYEAEVALGFVDAPWSRSCSSCSCNEEKNGDGNHKEEYEVYPMDYYARDGGPWNSSYAPKPRPRKV